MINEKQKRFPSGIQEMIFNFFVPGRIITYMTAWLSEIQLKEAEMKASFLGGFFRS